jgi:hypothetical protein
LNIARGRFVASRAVVALYRIPRAVQHLSLNIVAGE